MDYFGGESMVILLSAQEVQTQLKLKSRPKAIEIMERLPHIDLSPRGAKKRNLRVMEDTFDAYCHGKICLDETNVIPLPLKQPQKVQLQKKAAAFVAYRL